MNYEKVPTIISTKDLDYLEDMFNWNYLAYKKMINSIDMINNLEIEEMIEKANDTFKENLNIILDILNEGGNHGQRNI